MSRSAGGIMVTGNSMLGYIEDSAPVSDRTVRKKKRVAIGIASLRDFGYPETDLYSNDGLMAEVGLCIKAGIPTLGTITRVLDNKKDELNATGIAAFLKALRLDYDAPKKQIVVDIDITSLEYLKVAADLKYDGNIGKLLEDWAAGIAMAATSNEGSK